MAASAVKLGVFCQRNPTAGVPAMMDGVDKQTNTGIFAKNIETLELKNVTVSGQAGDAIISDGIDQFVQ